MRQASCGAPLLVQTALFGMLLAALLSQVVRVVHITPSPGVLQGKEYNQQSGGQA